MYADIWPDRIDIRVNLLETNPLPQEAWGLLLNDLKAKHVPSFTPLGERIAVTGGVDYRIYVTVHRTALMSDEEITRILTKYRIRANIPSDKSGPA